MGDYSQRGADWVGRSRALFHEASEDDAAALRDEIRRKILRTRASEEALDRCRREAAREAAAKLAGIRLGSQAQGVADALEIFCGMSAGVIHIHG